MQRPAWMRMKRPDWLYMVICVAALTILITAVAVPLILAGYAIGMLF